MALVKPYIFQIVGYQNCGKTTLINTLIKNLSPKNIEVGIIKHHGHGGRPDINEEKDAAKYIQSGAKASIVEGDGRLILQAEKKKWTLEEQIKSLHSFELDLLLIEGHKLAEFPKALIIKNTEDLHLIKELSNIKVVFFWNERIIPEGIELPTFLLNRVEGLNWMIKHLEMKSTGTMNNQSI
ncbi:molybdopterin-guanine dinucleotide biosynthesis protein B [Neobacillus sp. D3-1R]|uniref:molybdopterin-guanine dinucleotide biosynthesis protein B n=1 Tax=Neobacillus sp. D3-1R TaxID=3445778 RepID=UPI003F9F7DE9